MHLLTRESTIGSGAEETLVMGEEAKARVSQCSKRDRREGGFLTIDLPRGGKLEEFLRTNQYLPTCIHIN